MLLLPHRLRPLFLARYRISTPQISNPKRLAATRTISVFLSCRRPLQSHSRRHHAPGRFPALGGQLVRNDPKPEADNLTHDHSRFQGIFVDADNKHRRGCAFFIVMPISQSSIENSDELIQHCPAIVWVHRAKQFHRSSIDLHRDFSGIISRKRPFFDQWPPALYNCRSAEGGLATNCDLCDIRHKAGLLDRIREIAARYLNIHESRSM